jgi:vacuolar-type H+-ATPase subunit F/Vma7
MGRVVAIAGDRDVEGFALVGVTVLRTESDDDVAAAWEEASDAGLVIVSAHAAEVLGPRLEERHETLTVTLP